MEGDPFGWGARCERNIVPLPVKLRLPRDGVKRTMDIPARIFVHRKQAEPEFESCWVCPGLYLLYEALVASSAHLREDSHRRIVARLVVPADHHRRV